MSIGASFRVLSALALACAACGDGASNTDIGPAGSVDAGPDFRDASSEVADAGSAPTVRLTPYFSLPRLNLLLPVEDDALDLLLTSLLDRARPGSQVRATLYKFGNKALAQPFIDAHDRGVDVKLVLDDTSREDTYKGAAADVIEGLGEENVWICPRPACVGDKNNHNKFYLFSEIDGVNGPVHNVVLQSSANLKRDHRLLFNDSLVIEEDKKLYDLYLHYWQAMKSETPITDYMNGPMGMGEGDQRTRTHVFFSPSLSTDPILEVLQKTACPNGGTIRIAQSNFKNDRALRLMQELVRARDQRNCDIALVLRKAEDDNHHVDALKEAGLTVYYFTLLGQRGLNVHSKYVLIDAEVDIDGSKARRKLVLTGSSNFSDSGLRNDETILRIESDALYEQYIANWRHMRDFLE